MNRSSFIPLLFLLFFSSHLYPSEKKELQIGDYALSFRLKAYNQEKIRSLISKPYLSLHDFCGFGAIKPKNLIILHFYATWCKQCIKDLKFLQKLYKKYGDSGLLPISICINNKDFSLVLKDIEESAITFPILRDRFSIVARRYLIHELPTLFLIDKNGKILLIEKNYKELPLFIERQIKDLLFISRD